ncbi:MAG: Nif11-like leader peptide family natural product precursor [Deltaproteobacteria bacterium]|nr:MAG: Nif11-like leader peptide family natural product precursor [Deltaproteobacteria bacterium]
MSVQSAKDFLKRIKTDKALKDRLEGEADLESRQRIIKAAGFSFTLAEYREVIEELAAAAGKEMTPKELEGIAGGFGRRLGAMCAPDFKMPPTAPE